MIYAGDQWIQYPVKDLYDKQIMAMAVNTAKDMYEKGQKQIDDFYSEYGDFMSPIQKDMDWYNQNVIGRAKDTINNLYAHGIDPLRSAEGRAAVSQLIYSMPTGEIAKRKQSAEIAKEYVKNYGALDAAGKLDPNFERFMMNGMSLQDWDTGVNGVWGRYSPSEYKTLQEYVHPSFANIKPHMMSEQEVKDRGYKYDPRYEYTGVSRADMEQSMKDWLPGVRNEGIYRYYREQAKQDLIRRGYKNPTDDQIDAQFVDNAITADHQMMTPLTRHADQFAVQEQAHRNETANIYLQNKLQRERENDRYNHQLQLQLLKNQGKVPSKYKSLGNPNSQSVYHVTEETQLDGIYKQLKELGVKIPRLTIKDGKLMRQVDKKGNQLYRDIDDASAEELRYAAAHKNQLLRAVSTKMKSLSNKYGSDYLNNDTAQADFLNTFGYKIGGEQANAFFKNKKPAENGGILLTKEDLRKMETLPTIMAGTFNSGKKFSNENKLKYILKAWDSKSGENAYDRAMNAGKAMNIQWTFDSTSPINTIERPAKNGGTEVLLKGTSRIQWGDTDGDMMDVEQWLPIGLVSEKAAKSGNRVKASDFELRGENRSGYLDIDAGYMKTTGSQKQANPALTDLGLESVESMMDSFYDQNSLEEILNQLQQ